MKAWEIFEIESTNYLNKSIKIPDVRFECTGGSNSFANDINVIHNKKNLFSLESKFSPSQSGQIVVRVDKTTNKFVATGKQLLDIDEQIINLINSVINSKGIDLYNLFFDSKGIQTPATITNSDIGVDKDTIANRVKEFYKGKDSRFFITSSKLGSYKAIIPVEYIDSVFDYGFTIRRKKSGTRQLALIRKDNAIKNLRIHSKNIGVKLTNVSSRINEKGARKTIVTFDKKISGNHKYFGLNHGIGDYNFFLSDYDVKANIYEIKERSATNNINIIFNMKYIGVESNIGIDDLRNYINKFFESNPL